MDERHRFLSGRGSKVATAYTVQIFPFWVFSRVVTDRLIWNCALVRFTACLKKIIQTLIRFCGAGTPFVLVVKSSALKNRSRRRVPVQIVLAQTVEETWDVYHARGPPLSSVRLLNRMFGWQNTFDGSWDNFSLIYSYLDDTPAIFTSDWKCLKRAKEENIWCWKIKCWHMVKISTFWTECISWINHWNLPALVVIIKIWWIVLCGFRVDMIRCMHSKNIAPNYCEII